MRRNFLPALWLAAVTVSLGLVLAACNTTTTSGTSSTGSLSLALSGLPSGIAGDVVVTGPNSYSKTIKASTTLSGLPAGSYNVTPQMVDANSFPYTAATQHVTVSSGTTASATVAYALTGGAVHIIFTYVPLSGGLTFAPNPYGVTLSGLVTKHMTTGNNNLTIPDLPAGSYSVQPDSWANTACSAFHYTYYTTTVVSSPVTVTKGNVGTVSITYTALPHIC